jgi:predicted ATPase/DNA-binding CsgD family transcriptional regulator
VEQGVHGGAGDEFNAFIGRERELGELRLLVPTARALTLSGTGGIGKTRLALHLVAELAGDYPDGAWFVELADLRQPELVTSRIASAIGVIEEPGRPLLATLADALRQRRVLIGLDNCEHLIDACARVCQRLLASSPGLQVITTSREPLRVAAETVWQVPPLSMPPSAPGHAGLPGQEMPRSDAVTLFADRAAAARPGFELGPANLAAVTAICQSLDGLPLAIELAAAWVRVLTVEQIAARLADRFRLLSSAEWAAPPRHRTLRAAIDWSHDLLSPAERVLLRRLSVFATWPLEMAEAACGGDLGGADGGDLAARDIVDLVTALADKSLIMAEIDIRHKVRYRMLDTIREYAAARLAEAGESDAMHVRFHEYAVRETEQLARVGMALDPAPWSARVDTFHRFEADAANVRQILSRCLETGDAETGLRICASARPVWIVQGSFAEGSRWIDAFLDLDSSSLPASVLGPALISRAQLALATDPAEAGQHAKAGLELCRAEGSEFWAASALNLLAEAALHAGQVDESRDRATEALQIAQSSGDRFNEGYAFGTIGALAAFGGDLDEARRLGEAALGIARDIDQLWGAARAFLGLGDLARLIGDLDRARRQYTEALVILRQIGARPQVARCLAGLGRIAISQAELPLARQYLRDSLELWRSTGSRIGVIRGLESFAALARAERDAGLAVRLAAAATALRQEANLPAASPARVQRTLDAAAAAGLGQEAIDSLWASGSRLGSEDAITLALGTPAEAPAEADGPGGPGGPGKPGGPGGPGGSLTAREAEITALVARGYSNREIADELVISPATVARHIANIMGKLAFTSRVQIAAWALEQPTDRGTGR